MNRAELAGHILDHAVGHRPKIPRHVVRRVLSHSDPEVLAVVAGHRIMDPGVLARHVGGSKESDALYGKLEDHPDPRVTRALARNQWARIESLHKLATHPDMWTNAGVWRGVALGGWRSERHWGLAKAADTLWGQKLYSMVGSHGWKPGPQGEWPHTVWSTRVFTHPDFPGHELRVEAPSKVNPHGVFYHRGLPADEKLNYHRSLGIAEHGWHAGHGPELEKHLQAFHARLKESTLRARLEKLHSEESVSERGLAVTYYGPNPVAAKAYGPQDTPTFAWPGQKGGQLRKAKRRWLYRMAKALAVPTNGRGKSKETTMGKLSRLIEKAEKFLERQLAFDPSNTHPDNTSDQKTSWARSWSSDEKRLDAFKKELADRAERRRFGIQQELPFTYATGQGMSHEDWADLTTSKQRQGHTTYYEPKYQALLVDWHKAASNTLERHGFKRAPVHDVRGGFPEGSHASRHTAWVHPSGARVTLGHHVARDYYGAKAHPELPITGHAVYWGYRNDKSRSWGNRASAGRFGRVPVDLVPGEHRTTPRWSRPPTKEVSIHDAVVDKRKKEGWQIVSHSLRALSGTLKELHPALGTGPSEEVQTTDRGQCAKCHRPIPSESRWLGYCSDECAWSGENDF